MTHREWSYIKSGVRFAGYVALAVAGFIYAGAILFVAEVLGILEERGQP